MYNGTGIPSLLVEVVTAVGSFGAKGACEDAAPVSGDECLL